jgi:protein-S-isoprenylcysteine O-methyltransferase Ste14
MDLFLDVLVLVVSLGIVAQHVWALRGHFTSEKMAPRAMLVSATVTLTTLLYSAMIWFWLQPAWAAVAGLVVELASLLLFWAAIKASAAARLRFAFDDDKPRTLVTIGPYKVVRHPFYTSYLLFWIGWALATWSLWSVLPVVALAAMYVVAARFEEGLFAETALAGDYEAYKRRAGLFWPKF